MDELHQAGKYVNKYFPVFFISMLVAFIGDLLTEPGYKDLGFRTIKRLNRFQFSPS